MGTITFITSLLTFYLKGEIRHEQNFIKIKKPNTILSLIPLGSKTNTMPINQISSVETNFKLLFKPFLVGLIIAIVGLTLLSDSFVGGVVVFLIGAAMVINSFQTELHVNLTSGKVEYVFFLIFEKKKAEMAAEQINTLISNRMDDTNTRVHTEKQTDALIDAIGKLKE